MQPITETQLCEWCLLPVKAGDDRFVCLFHGLDAPEHLRGLLGPGIYPQTLYQDAAAGTNERQ